MLRLTLLAGAITAIAAVTAAPVPAAPQLAMMALSGSYSAGSDSNSNANGGTDQSTRVKDNSIHNNQMYNIVGPGAPPSAVGAPNGGLGSNFYHGGQQKSASSGNKGQSNRGGKGKRGLEDELVRRTMEWIAAAHA